MRRACYLSCQIQFTKRDLKKPNSSHFMISSEVCNSKFCLSGNIKEVVIWILVYCDVSCIALIFSNCLPKKSHKNINKIHIIKKYKCVILNLIYLKYFDIFHAWLFNFLRFSWYSTIWTFHFISNIVSNIFTAVVVCFKTRCTSSLSRFSSLLWSMTSSSAGLSYNYKLSSNPGLQHLAENIFEN